MGAIEKMRRLGKLPLEPESQSIDALIAEAEARAGVSGKVEQVAAGFLDDSPIVARGSSIRVLGERIAVELRPGLGKIGDLFITGTMKDTRNQTFTRAKVVAIGATALGMNGVMLYEEVVVSEYFGQEIKLIEGDETRKLRVGRLRDIVGVLRSDGCLPRGDRVLVEKIQRPKMAGLLHLPEDMMVQDFKAKVVAAGPDATVKRGDVVIVAKDTSVRVRFEGADMQLVDEPSILVVL